MYDMKNKKKKTIKETAKAIVKMFTHHYEDDHVEEMVNPKLRLATK